MTTPTQPERSGWRSRRSLLALGAAGTAVVVAVVVLVAVHLTGGGNDAQAAPSPLTASRSAGGTTTVTTTTPPTVTLVTPAAGATGVPANSPLTVTYSKPVAGDPPTPTLNPAVAGTWRHQGNTLTFTPAGGWLPYAKEIVTVPQVTGGAPVTSSFTVDAGDRNRLEQMLAELGYLPFTVTPDQPLPAGDKTALDAEATTPDAVVTTPLVASLNWSWATVPPTLSALWAPGKANVMDQGAIMAFESDHGLKMDGVPGPNVWSTLVAAVAGRVMDKNPYDYLVASEALPETLTVYRGGQVLYTTRANTGVAGAATAKGTFPVYSRFASTEMKGTNPDGTKYDDKDIPWVAYFNGGDAVHGFVRHSYGYPQSNGCVELPVANAANVWPMDPYGTLVTVTG